MTTVTDLKEKGDEAFKKNDYAAAVSMYSAAIDADRDNQTCYLNRSLANLKLERWSDAERDATEALRLGYKGVKALYRRAVARRELGDFAGALEDLEKFIKAGGDSQTLETERGKIPAFRIADSPGKGLGAFALKPLKRGDLILSEQELFRVSEQDDDRLNQAAALSAIRALSPDELQQFLTLQNAHRDTGRFKNPLIGTYQTNSFAMDNHYNGIFLQASRFNHSCSPNARYSWNSTLQRFRIHALRDIAIGEEIFVSYLSSRNVYGSTRQARQARLARYSFTCTCVACSLQGAAAQASDARRTEVARIWESNPYIPPNRTRDRLSVIVRAIRLPQEEGYAADYDDFTVDAASVCAYHSDWDSARYWATKTYETRVAEFGEGSPRAMEVRPTYLDPKKIEMAGRGMKQKFSIRL